MLAVRCRQCREGRRVVQRELHGGEGEPDVEDELRPAVQDEGLDSGTAGVELDQAEAGGGRLHELPVTPAAVTVCLSPYQVKPRSPLNHRVAS